MAEAPQQEGSYTRRLAAGPLTVRMHTYLGIAISVLVSISVRCRFFFFDVSPNKSNATHGKPPETPPVFQTKYIRLSFK